MATYNDVLTNYQLINQSFQKLRYYLIQQLEKCFLTDLDNYNFTELIEAVGDIEAVEHYNSHNIKPSQKPEIDSSNLTAYNESLYFRIRYYMRLLAYYLVLKGVSTDAVANQNSLTGLISLIELIDVKLPVTMTVQNVTEEYYFGLNINLDYTLTDIYGNTVNDGEITIEADGILYDSIQAGTPISFTPLRISEKVNGEYEPIIFTITYRGSDKYRSCQSITRNIIVKPAKITLNAFIYNNNPLSRFYNSSIIGYTSDTWNILVKTYNYKGEVLGDIPFTISMTTESTIDDDVDAEDVLNFDASINEITDENGSCLIDCVINQLGDNTINIATTYENTDLMTNVEVDKRVYIYYNPIYMEETEHIDYMGKNSYTYQVIIRNIYTGELYSNSLDGQTAIVKLDDNQAVNTPISDGRSIYTIQSMEKGEHKINWNINGNQLVDNVKIYSNFILPNKTKFFAAETPNIYYTPLYTATYSTNNWNPIIRKKAIADIIYYDEEDNIQTIETDMDVYTDSNGILHTLKNYNQFYTYSITLKTDSDNLDETISYTYEIAKPFDIIINEEETNTKEQVVFNIKIYDKEHYQTGNHTNYISFNKDFTGLYTFSEYEEDEYYNIDITVPMRIETIGKNTLTVEVNNYSESIDFKLIDHIFSLLTDNVSVGDQQFLIQCFDDEIEDISIDSEYIIVDDYTKNNGVFTVNAAFIKAGTITFNINSDNNTETFTIIVNKGTLTPNIVIEKYTPYTEEVIDEETQQTVVLNKNYIEEVDECSYDETEKMHVRLEIDSLYDNINITYSIGSYTEAYSVTNENDRTIPKLIPNVYTISFDYYSGNNSNYNSFHVEEQFTITKNNPTITIEEQYSTFDDTIIFKPLLDGTTPVKVGYGEATQENGIVSGKGIIFAEGWSNEGLWKCDFDLLHDPIQYTGILFVGDVNMDKPYYDSGAKQVANWEGSFFGQRYANYTDGRVGWLHVTVQKMSNTSLKITLPTYGLTTVYEWADLSTLETVTCGSVHNKFYGEIAGLTRIKNVVVRRLD